VLYFREGWNYLLELYFWIIIGALLLVSLTIYFARPSQSNTNKYIYNSLEGQIGQMPGGNPSKSEETDVKKSDKQKADEVDEKLNEEIIKKIERRRWALSFVIFGSAFTMAGAILLLLFNYDIMAFLGSCMIYIGLIALIKGVSFELQKDNNYYSLWSVFFFLIIFFINFILLTDLLKVLGTYAWTVASPMRKAGDLALIYILPFVVWKLVPTFGGDDNLKVEPLYRINFRSLLLLSLFNYIILLATSLEFIFWPELNQYVGPGFQISMVLLILSIFIELIWPNDKEQLVMDTEIDNEEEGRAIRDFSEENEDVYFEDEYEDEVVNE
tara:strand:+ start:85 stop:1065 length:981 start_codon:yes stop_codon:yes gene_type:complete